MLCNSFPKKYLLKIPRARTSPYAFAAKLEAITGSYNRSLPLRKLKRVYGTETRQKHFEIGGHITYAFALSQYFKAKGTKVKGKEFLPSIIAELIKYKPTAKTALRLQLQKSAAPLEGVKSGRISGASACPRFLTLGRASKPSSY